MRHAVRSSILARHSKAADRPIAPPRPAPIVNALSVAPPSIDAPPASIAPPTSQASPPTSFASPFAPTFEAEIEDPLRLAATSPHAAGLDVIAAPANDSKGRDASDVIELDDVEVLRAPRSAMPPPLPRKPASVAPPSIASAPPASIASPEVPAPQAIAAANVDVAEPPPPSTISLPFWQPPVTSTSPLAIDAPFDDADDDAIERAVEPTVFVRRRAHFTKYVKGVVAACGLLCAIAIVRKATSGPDDHATATVATPAQSAAASPPATPALAMPSPSTLTASIASPVAAFASAEPESPPTSKPVPPRKQRTERVAPRPKRDIFGRKRPF